MELTLEQEMELAEGLVLDEMKLPEIGPVYYFSKLPIDLAEKKYKAEVELVPMGEWNHPMAPGGILKVTESLLKEFVENFVNKV